MPAVFLRTCEAKDSLERRVSWISSTSLSDRAKSLMAAFCIRAPTQTAPRLLIQSYLSRPQGQPGLASWMCGSRAHPLPLIFLPPSPLLCFMAGIWKPFLFTHSTRMLLLAVLQRAESSDSPQGHFRGCMRSSQLFAGSARARYIRVGNGHLCTWVILGCLSLRVGGGPCSAQIWVVVFWPIAFQPLSLFSDNVVFMSLGPWPGLRDGVLGQGPHRSLVVKVFMSVLLSLIFKSPAQGTGSAEHMVSL